MAAKTKTVEEVAVANVNARSHAGTTNDEKYLFCNLKNVKETFVGRAQSVQHNAEMPNGVLCWLGDLKLNETHIFEAKNAPTHGAISESKLPWVMFRPEITPYEDTRMDYVMGHFRMKADKPHPAWQLNIADRIEYSEEYFQDTPALNDYYELVYLNPQFGNKNNVVAAGTICWKVVNVHEVQTPIAYSNATNLVGMPESKKMYTLQLVVKPN